MSSQDLTPIRARFFSMAFGKSSGYACLAILNQEMKGFREYYFQWPSEGSTFLKTIEDLAVNNNVYFCPQLLTRAERKKDAIKGCPSVWADLDACDPENLKIVPTVIIESSPRRYQALWVLEEEIDPVDAEDYARRVAYDHRDQGADTSGWDLSQLLRVPYTNNYKYGADTLVTITLSTGVKYSGKEFEVYPRVEQLDYTQIAFPDELPSKTGRELLYQFRLQINPASIDLFETVPEEGHWSQRLWSLMMQCFEAGMVREQVFKVASDAACNKFKRDGRSERYLWYDVCRAFYKNEHNVQIARVPEEEEAPLLTADERKLVENANPGWVERYIDWARNLGDAAHQYHQASAFVALSSLVAGSVRLPTSFGTVVPNMWFMILADTTLTRKTTSMDLGMSIVDEVNDEVLLATDGSIEGLFASLSTRPGKPSVFLRDEFTGLLEQMTKRDYMAGFAEMLTKLYDGKVQKRVLRKETITVKDPLLIVYAGGIKSRMQLLMTLEQVSSGFLPRFVFITAESDVNRVKPMGPPTSKNLSARATIVEELREIYEHYNRKEEVVLAGRTLATNRNKIYGAELSNEAWLRYNQLEALLMKIGMASSQPEIYTPVYDRLGKSILKAALLIATARQRPDQNVVVEELDILRATYYGEGWRAYAKEIVTDVGVTRDERKVASVLKSIQRSEGGLHRSALMQNQRLTAKEADWLLATLEQRGLITRTKAGRGEVIHSTIRETKRRQNV